MLHSFRSRSIVQYNIYQTYLGLVCLIRIVFVAQAALLMWARGSIMLDECMVKKKERKMEVRSQSSECRQSGFDDQSRAVRKPVFFGSLWRPSSHNKGNSITVTHYVN